MVASLVSSAAIAGRGSASSILPSAALTSSMLSPRFYATSAPGAASSSSSPSTSSSGPSAASSSSAAPKDPLFHAHKSQTTGRWHPPTFSLRRQAQLVENVFALGSLDALPDGPKKERMMQRLRAQEAAAAALDPSVPAPSPSFAAVSASGVLPASFFQPLDKAANKYSPNAIRSHQHAIISALAREKGPYMGRVSKMSPKAAAYNSLRKIFKGRKTERNRPAKLRDIRENMKDMDTKVEEWRKEKAQIRAKKRPNQPF